MKNLLSIILLLMTISTVFGQTEKGSKEYSISFRGNYATDYGLGSSLFQKKGTFTLTNRYGWFVKDNVAAGILLGLSYTGGSSLEVDQPDQFSFSFGGYTRRYFSVGRFTPFLEANLLYSRGVSDPSILYSKSVVDTGEHRKHSNALHLNLQLGTLFKVNDWLSLEANYAPLFNARYSSHPEGATSVSLLPTLSLSNLNLGARFKI